MCIRDRGEIRKALIEVDMVDCMIALPGQLFYTTQIPVCLWFLTRSKKADTKRGFRSREGETLFIDARKLGTLIDRTHRELSDEEIAEIGRDLDAGNVAVVVTCDAFEVPWVTEFMTGSGGTVRSYAVPQEALAEVAQSPEVMDSVAERPV